MSRNTTSSFVHEIPLKTAPWDESEIEKRFDAGKNLRNACLSHCLEQIQLMRESKDWRIARSLPKGKERNKLYQSVRKRFAFSEYELHKFAAKIAKACWIGKHLDSQVIQKIASKVYTTADEYLCGKKGRPRFTRYRGLKSLEGKSNLTGLRWKNGVLVWNIKSGTKLEIQARFDHKDKDGLEAYALNCRVKYVRIIRRRIKKNNRYFVQLILEGTSFNKEKNIIADDCVGLDLGPSSIAAVSSKKAFLGSFCEGLESKQHEIKTIQRKMDRSRRKTNPSNYEEDGTLKKGPKRWGFSKKYIQLRSEHQELYRKLSETRKRLHGELANQVLSMGKHVKLEKLSYLAFQKIYGRSVGAKAPGMFVSLLRRKAESAGGKVEEFSTYKTCLSQTCHCGRKSKKKLSERWHKCPCNAAAQRDLYRAFLAIFVENDTLNTCQASNAWPVADPLLEHAVLRLNKQAKGKARLSSFGLGQRQSLSHVKGESLLVEAVDDVGVMPRATERLEVCL